MTNKEAIEILNTMFKDGRYLGNGTHIPLEVLESFNKAIEALEDITEISNALVSITERESFSYGFADTCDKAEKWVEERTMDKPKCCWNCKHLVVLNPEEDKCKLDGHIFDDRFLLSVMRDKECPLDISERKENKC